MRLIRSMAAAMATVLVGSIVPATGLAADAAAAPVEVKAVEYAFVGMPTSVPVGTSFRLVNAGQEDHEFSVVRINDGVTETLEELLAMPEEQAATKFKNVGIVFADTGQTSLGTLTLDQGGRYVVACFIPQGTKNGVSPSPAPGSTDGQAGTPHAFLGMLSEFTVGDAGTSPGPVSTPVGS